jgi:NTP pyrophosphatase (non-canonical NTP hydrolase)
MDLNEYQKLSMRTMPKEINGMSKSNYGMGLAGEAGEIVDLIKKEVHHGHFPQPGLIREELGDLMHYVVGVATLYGLTLDEICEENIWKLKKRYPNGFNTEDSIKRVDVNDSR